MTRPITLRFQDRCGGQRSIEITPRWAGASLAVHKPVDIDDSKQPFFRDNCPGIWALSHIPTGFSAGMFHGNLTRAIRFARQWDSRFAAVTGNKLPEALKKEYTAALCFAQDEPTEADLIEAEV